jgi:hypothetical protein
VSASQAEGRRFESGIPLDANVVKVGEELGDNFVATFARSAQAVWTVLGPKSVRRE